MNQIPFSVQRSSILSEDELQKIEETALRILDELGIIVTHQESFERLSKLGFAARGNHIRIARETAQSFLDQLRSHEGRQLTAQKLAEKTSPVLDLAVSAYPQCIHDIQTDRLVPMTTERLIDAVKLTDSLADRGVVSSPPGCPSDVAPPLQPVAQYRIAAGYSRFGRKPVDPKASISLPYIMDMAEVLGNPLRSLPVYVFSPLALGSESLQCVLDFHDRISSVSVGNMASPGCTASIHVGDACALAVAETLGSALLIQELTRLPTSFHIRLCPIDLRSLAMVFGSPEDLLLQLVNNEVNAYFHGEEWIPWTRSIHTNAKLPGAQACAEKASLMTAGALLGARRFSVAGTLSLDEVFSAEQLLYDIEIKDHVQRLVRGIDTGCDSERCLADTAEALQSRSYTAVDSTLAGYRDFYWHPRLFERNFLAAWRKDGEKPIRREAHRLVQELIEKHEYELDSELRKELDGIVAHAKEELA